MSLLSRSTPTVVVSELVLPIILPTCDDPPLPPAYVDEGLKVGGAGGMLVEAAVRADTMAKGNVNVEMAQHTGQTFRYWNLGVLH